MENLIGKSITGDLTPDESKILKDWRLSDPEHEKEYLEYELAWSETELASAHAPVPDMEESWKKLSDTLQLEKQPLKKTPVLNLWKYVAAAAMIAGLSIFSYWLAQPTIITYSTTIGDRKTITLPDGSIVMMNFSSEISFVSDGFGEKHRDVKLVGETFFDIQKSIVPFNVRTTDFTVSVKGTSFNINTRSQKPSIAVKTGHVGVTSTVGQRTVDLTAGWMTESVNAQLTEPKPVETAQIAGWKEGHLLFEGSSLIDVVEEIEGYFGISIELKNSSLSQKKITASFTHSKPDVIIRSIALSIGGTATQTSEGWELK